MKTRDALIIVLRAATNNANGHENAIEILNACEVLNTEPIPVDYWCRDCQDWFRAEQTPVHAPQTPCPKCQGENTYEAYAESGFD